MSTRSETELIRLIERMTGLTQSARMRVGIGDDAAVLAPPPSGLELLATTDQIVEGKHFIVDQHPPDALGHKLLVRGLSDIAAMGGSPSWFLLSLAIPARLNNSWIERFLTGLLAGRHKAGIPELPLAGGDVSGSDAFLAHITVVGAVPQGRALLRSGARPGDRLYVSGELGGSALGLEKLSQGELDDAASLRHLWPEPRLRVGAFLRECGASAALDLSDGLSTDLHHLASSSRVGMRVDLAALPGFPGAEPGHVLHGGEEYELLFTAPPTMSVPDSIDGIRITRIGVATEQPEVLLVRDGREEPLTPGGFEHLIGA